MYTKISLNGKWKLQPGDLNPPNEYSHSIIVPSLVDTAKPALNFEQHKYFWYKKDFNLPDKMLNKKVYLQLEQVMFGTEIWVNNKKIGGDIQCYTSQEFDITPYLQVDHTNCLLIRIGRRETLPKHSAVGNDYEKLSWIPGIYGDVWLHGYGEGRTQWTRIVSDAKTGKISVTTILENLVNNPRLFTVSYQIFEKKNRRKVTQKFTFVRRVEAKAQLMLKSNIIIPDFRLWSPQDPFLYQLEICLIYKGEISDRQIITFGIRSFSIKGGHFYLNGQRIVLVGSNIPFHRLLSDPHRNRLPWNVRWIKKALVEIPKSHNMFFFRFHLGHAYNRWYDIADEHGILLQDEWMFWTVTGSYPQIEKELTAWVRENINHPSIVIWGALNETMDKTIQTKIIPHLKKIDPTRPWELVDFPEDHPYIYSLGPVLNEKKFGYARSIFEFSKRKAPAMISEYLWWWLDEKSRPTFLTEMVIERWLGIKNPSPHKLLQHQMFLAGELTELWRRLDIDAIMPFVYLSTSRGATANWFLGPLKLLKPKPILQTLKNAFSPIGLSLEIWDRHYLTGEHREFTVYLFNDTSQPQKVNFELQWRDEQTKLYSQKNLRLAPHQHLKKKIKVIFDRKPGQTELIGIIYSQGNSQSAMSKKPVIIFHQPSVPARDKIPPLCLHDINREQEVRKFLKKHQFPTAIFPENLENSKILFVNAGSLDKIFNHNLHTITNFVMNGGILILQEPEYGIYKEANIPIVDGIELTIRYRLDQDQGGYDSYVFPTRVKHPLWKNLKTDYLKMFNGGLGGEIVSQYNVRPTVPYNTLANCHLYLKVPAVMEVPFGKGWIIISRIQIRGRLLIMKKRGLFQRRYDPVAEQYFWNLLQAYLNRDSYQKSIFRKLQKKSLYISRVKYSPHLRVDVFDIRIVAHWTSDKRDWQFLNFDIAKSAKVNKIRLQWEIAEAIDARLFYASDTREWKMFTYLKKSIDRIVELEVSNFQAHHYRIVFREYGHKWGLSSLHVEIF